MDLTIHHIPVCPFSQRVKILLTLKGIPDAAAFHVVDITKPRDPRLLELSGGTTALPVLEVGGRGALKESRVILRFFEDSFPDRPVARRDPYEHGLESIMEQGEAAFSDAGYGFVLNQDPSRRDAWRKRMLDRFRWIDGVLRAYAPGQTFFFEDFGWAETVYTPLFQRFWFLDYYEGFALPDTQEFARVRRWRDACLAHPAAQQVTYEEIVTLYYDYAKGTGNGGLVEGRARSSFVFEPDWRERPMPPADKYGHSATDAELGLLPG